MKRNHRLNSVTSLPKGESSSFKLEVKKAFCLVDPAYKRGRFARRFILTNNKYMDSR